MHRNTRKKKKNELTLDVFEDINPNFFNWWSLPFNIVWVVSSVLIFFTFLAYTVAGGVLCLVLSIVSFSYFYQMNKDRIIPPDPIVMLYASILWGFDTVKKGILLLKLTFSIWDWDLIEYDTKPYAIRRISQ